MSGPLRQSFINQGLVVPEGARKLRPLSPDELECQYPIAAYHKRNREPSL